ncbi:MAG: acyl-CoA dehydrogenase [Deltaproteobacteria bacterium]|nr:acyl-CoA dehydrogenase [Deltaproteobacteria bacterium]
MPSETQREIGAEELHRYRDLARRFAKRSLEPLFAADYPDGNLAFLPQAVEIAFSTGIVASPEPSMPGNVYGIWGSATDELGMTPSLLLLSTIAETCAGIAFCFHAQGLASNLALPANRELARSPARVALCLQEGFSPPYLGTINEPDHEAPVRISTSATVDGQGYIIDGKKSFVYSLDGVEAYVVFARVGEKWGAFLVPANDSGVVRSDVGPRTGLRACRLENVEFNRVRVNRAARIDEGGARELVLRALGLNWAGMSAIAVGIARGAVSAARRYAAERYQGGSRIENHAAVKLLIGGAQAAAEAAELSVFSLTACDFTKVRTLVKPAATKMTVLDLCARAVTDSLQAFGGYGYMEDFGMEKRLRDITVLKSAAGSPRYLRQLIYDIERDDVE